jgi:hypothetical protein
MRFLLQLLFITILASIMELFLPWWSIAVAAIVGGYLFTTRANFLAGFLSIVILWFITSITIDLTAGAPLTEKVAAIFSTTKPILFVITSLIGGLVGGFAAMAGGALRKDRRRMKYY